MRKSIFDIASESINMENEVNRIILMSQTESNAYCYRDYTLFEFVDRYCFKDWAHRGHFLNVSDFTSSIHYSRIKKDAREGNVDAFIIMMELILNFWYLADANFKSNPTFSSPQKNFYHLRDVILDNLEKYNHKVYYEDERILIVEDKPEVTAAAEIVEQELAVKIIRYNHRSMRGNIEAKKAVLLALGSELEPKRKELQDLSRQLSEDIFFMLNNLNLRHNNINEGDKNYKAIVANMSKDELEVWYDEIYQMMLLAILLLDNTERKSRVKKLKDGLTEQG